METEETRPIMVKRTLIEIREQGTVVITEEFLNQLKYVCSKISTVEWSGLIFFTTKGEPENLKDFIITPYYIHLMDKGTGGATEFDDDGSQKELYEAMPELDPFEGNGYRYGKIHSHNTMQVFHSPTDEQDLQDQAAAYKEYYFSLIVNNFMDIEAKMAFVAEIPDQSITPKGFKGMGWTLPKKDVLVTVDFEIEMEGADLTIPEALKDRLEVIDVHKPIHNWHAGGWNNNRSMLPSYELDDEVSGHRGYSTEEYRVIQGKISFRAFLHTYFEEKVEVTTVFSAACKLTPAALEILRKATLEWFEELGNWGKQNMILYITDVELSEDEKNLEQLYESIYESIKVEVD